MIITSSSLTQIITAAINIFDGDQGFKQHEKEREKRKREYSQIQFQKAYSIKRQIQRCGQGTDRIVEF